MLMNCWKSCSFCGKLEIYFHIDLLLFLLLFLLLLLLLLLLLHLLYFLLMAVGQQLQSLWLKFLFFLFSAHMQLHASINIQTNAHCGRNMVNARRIKHLWKKIAGKVARSVRIACIPHLYLICLFVCVFVFLAASLSLTVIVHFYTWSFSQVARIRKNTVKVGPKTESVQKIQILWTKTVQKAATNVKCVVCVLSRQTLEVWKFVCPLSSL